MGTLAILLVVVVVLLLTFFWMGQFSPDKKIVTKSGGKNFILWLTQGFGVGRIPFAPGTFGSLVGLLWFALLLTMKNVWLFAIGIILGIAISIWLCSKAEKILNQKDPGSVVLDEICAMPVCFVASLGIFAFKNGNLPTSEFYFSEQGWLHTVVVFAFFRFFDVVKPWPIRGSQNLPSGWGVTVDDLLASVYVNVCVMAVFLCSGTR